MVIHLIIFWLTIAQMSVTVKAACENVDDLTLVPPSDDSKNPFYQKDGGQPEYMEEWSVTFND